MSRPIRHALAVLTAAVLASWPALAHACATCGIGNGRNNIQIFWSTITLSLLPLILLAGLGVWIVRRTRAFIREEFRDGDEQLLQQADAIRATQGSATER